VRPTIDSVNLSPRGAVPAADMRGTRSMPSLITGDHLRTAVEKNTFIKSGVVKSVEGAKYDFRMSPIILKSSFVTPVNIEKLPEDKRSQAVVDSGDVVFVKTIELLDLPNTMIATLSPKRKLSHLGIIVLGGLAVDPKYKGPLFIGLYNFSSTPFPLLPGRKLIAAMFYNLCGDELAEFPELEPLSDQDEFPDDLISLIRNYKPVELRGLNEAVSRLQGEFDALQEEVRDDRTWKKEFREGLEAQSKLIKDLLDGLKEEIDNRKQEDFAIKTRLDKVSDVYAGFRAMGGIIALFVAAILGGFAGYFIPKMFGGH
jgi:deoxycytidine triphosphate deaminase